MLMTSTSFFAQTIRKYSNEFLNIGVDAAALGMSNAVTAQSSDVNSGYWNPAGILQLEDKQIALMHANYFANIAQYDYAGFAMPIDDRSAWGISLIRFGVDDILNTTQLIDSQGNIDYNRISLFSTADYGVTFSYARKLPVEGFNYGVNAKIIRRVIGDFASSWGFGLDAGIQFSNDNGWAFGLMARDITTTFNSWAIDEDKLADIQDAIDDGVIVISSAGNSYWNCSVSGDADYNNTYVNSGYPVYHSQGSSPGSADNVICVGSISSKVAEYKSNFSNWGSRVDIWGPGSDIISAVFDQSSATSEGYGPIVADSRDSSYYLASISGTSMSGPQVCGVIACIAQNQPNITTPEVLQYLKENSLLFET